MSGFKNFVSQNSSSFGKYVAGKITQSVIGKAVKYGFWSLVVCCPTSLIAAVGFQGIAISALAVHSGLIEYGASKIVIKSIK